MKGKERAWWGDFHLDIGETACWHLGPLALWVRREYLQWEVACTHFPERAEIAWQIPCAEAIPLEADHRAAYGISGARRLRLSARLADRPLVWRPETPLFIVPDQSLMLLLRSPLWVGVYVDGNERPLCEFPVRRLSDTWLGSPMEKGGYAYAGEPDVFFHAEEIPDDSLHATTPVLIRNESPAPLPVERISLPLPFLSLFSGERGLWTQRMTLERGAEDEELALVQVGKGLPEEAVSGKLLARPREEAEKNLVFQAFSRIFR